MKAHYQSVFISDLHLGSKGCKSNELLKFLKSFDCENLYIVGDLIDVWVMKSLNQWEQEHTDIVQKILKKTKKNFLFYSPGNHDEMFKQFCGNHFGHVNIDVEFIYEAINGKKYLITHGDLYDSFVYTIPKIAYLVSHMYESLTNLNYKLNKFLVRIKKKPINISAIVKLKFKRYIKHLNNFENKLSIAAKKQNCDGVICGHIHLPCIKNIQNIEYMNCGDWVENCSALVEHKNGKWEIIKIS